MPQQPMNSLSLVNATNSARFLSLAILPSVSFIDSFRASVSAAGSHPIQYLVSSSSISGKMIAESFSRNFLKTSLSPRIGVLMLVLPVVLPNNDIIIAGSALLCAIIFLLLVLFVLLEVPVQVSRQRIYLRRIPSDRQLFPW